jgi:hypothetical protein
MKDFALCFWPLGWSFVLIWAGVFWFLMSNRYDEWRRDLPRELRTLKLCILFLPWAAMLWMVLDVWFPQQPAPLWIKSRKD